MAYPFLPGFKKGSSESRQLPTFPFKTSEDVHPVRVGDVNDPSKLLLKLFRYEQAAGLSRSSFKREAPNVQSGCLSGLGHLRGETLRPDRTSAALMT